MKLINSGIGLCKHGNYTRGISHEHTDRGNRPVLLAWGTIIILQSSVTKKNLPPSRKSRNVLRLAQTAKEQQHGKAYSVSHLLRVTSLHDYFLAA